ncbi:MAG: DUF262 domain-containing protein [Polyangiales bacterium]
MTSPPDGAALTSQPPSLPRLLRRSEGRTITVARILERVQRGELRIPDFQRPFRWRPKHVLDLLDSVYRGYPIGELLFSKQQAPSDTLEFGPVRMDAPAASDAWYVVDGQQRITALVGALLHPRREPRRDRCAAWFDLEAERFVRLEKGDPPAHWVPLRAVSSMVELSEWFDAWSLRKERPDLQRRARELQQAILEFEVPAYVVDGSSEVALREIFRRVNTSGIAMREDEVFEALYMRGGRHPVERACTRLHQATSFGVLRKALFLRCLKAVQGLLTKATLEDEDNSARMLESGALERTEGALRRAIEFLQEDADFPYGSVMPYLSPPLILLARFFSLHPTPAPRTRLLLRQWVWRSALSKRHATSSQGLIVHLQTMIDGHDEHATAQRLLRDAPPIGQLPTASLPWNPGNAEVRACMAALLSRVPPPIDAEIPETAREAEDPAAPADAAEHDAATPLAFSDVAGKRPLSVAAAFVAVPGGSLSLSSAPEETLRLHLVPPEALVALREGDVERFVRLRGVEMDRWLERYFRERAGEAESDRAPIGAISARVEALFEHPTP